MNKLAFNFKQATQLQRGQATLEYAIILILVVTMIIGGIELAATAFASSKASEAAKAGANEFANNILLSTKDVAGYIDSITDQNADIIVDETDYQIVLNNLTLEDKDGNPIPPDVELIDVLTARHTADRRNALLLIKAIHTPYLANHNPTLLTNPSCGAGDTYNDGLPNRYPTAGTANQIYLFNPLPIDLASCAGVDATRGNKSKISILVGGFGQLGDVNYVQGLPKLNQAMYGQYTKVCLNASNEYTSCNGAFSEMLLKPPGKLCLSNTVSNTVDSCTTDTPPIGSTGYYFWGQVNDSAADDFTYSNTETITFRPTFQLVCNGNSALDPNMMDGDCSDTANLKTVQVHTRYRAVFESFLTFGLLELTDANLAQYFFDPSNLRSLGANSGVGIAGSELGPKAKNKNVTVKQFKDFRGCYEVDVETNQVSACN